MNRRTGSESLPYSLLSRAIRLTLTASVIGLAVWLIFSTNSPFSRERVREPEIDLAVPGNVIPSEDDTQAELLSPLDLLDQGFWDSPNGAWSLAAKRFDHLEHAMQMMHSEDDVPEPSMIDSVDPISAANNQRLVQIARELATESTNTGVLVRHEIRSPGLHVVLFAGASDEFRMLRILMGSETPYTLVSIRPRTVETQDRQSVGVPTPPGETDDWNLPISRGVQVIATRRNASGVMSVQVLQLTDHPKTVLRSWEKKGWTLQQDPKLAHHWTAKDPMGNHYSMAHQYDGGTHTMVVMLLD